MVCASKSHDDVCHVGDNISYSLRVACPIRCGFFAEMLHFYVHSMCVEITGWCLPDYTPVVDVIDGRNTAQQHYPLRVG